MNDLTPILDVSDLHVGFDGFTVLDGMSFTVRRGEQIGRAHV